MPLMRSPTWAEEPFDRIAFRSDTAAAGIKNFDFTYGTFAVVVPEPGRACPLLGGFAAVMARRRRSPV